ncbi:MAG: 5-formyltetrahydrofolate cyclo-ligase [Candidatus Caldarchaeum sp.]
MRKSSRAMKSLSRRSKNRISRLDPAAAKQAIRLKIWSEMEKRGVAAFPKPVYGRIPNFNGAEDAANLLRKSKTYAQAEKVKVNPDSPQRPVRKMVLQDGKLLVFPSPRISKGLYVLDPRKITCRELDRASTIEGAFRYGVPTHPKDLPKIDLVVTGSVAVSPSGWRVGKGEGYSEIEYAILRTFGKVDEDTSVVTTIHDIQLVEGIPAEPFDVPIDKIFTNTKVITCPANEKPRGILWRYISEEKIRSIPLLSELRAGVSLA